jgi:colicin import membrane protein
VQWKTKPNTLSASAELWSAVPLEAAPAANEPDPTPPQPLQPPEPVKAVEPKPEPEPKPTPPAPPKVNTAAEREAADIALKKEKEKKLQEKKEADLEKKKKLEKDKLEKEKLDKEKEKEKAKEKEKEKAKELEKKKKDEALKKEVAAAKAKEDAKKAAAEEKRADALRNENLKRMQGMAGASGDENSKGTALKSSGPSANYRGRIVARIKSNIAFNPDVVNNPLAIVEIRTSPDGTILSYKIITPSGNKSWDDAVLKAIVKTAILPRDEDGHVPPIFEITFRPKD